jgi:hypothetical protein
MMPVRHRRIWGAAALALGLVAVWAIPAAFGQSTLNTYALSIGVGTKTATATSGAATLNQPSGLITSEALTTAAGATYTLTITNSTVAATDIPFASVYNGTNSAGTPVIATVTPASGTLTIVVRNAHASAAFNGTLKIAFATLEQ